MQFNELVLLLKAVPSISVAMTPRTPPELNANGEVMFSEKFRVLEPLSPPTASVVSFDSTALM